MPQTIVLSGIIVDRISYVSNKILISMFNPRNPEKCRQFLNDNLARIGASNKYQVLDAVEVLWRSLTADVFAVRLPRDGLPAAARAGLGRILHHMNTVNKQDPIVVSGVEDLGDGITQDV